MGQIERVAKKQRVWGHIQSGIVSVIGVAGILLVTMAAPNTFQLLGGPRSSKSKFNYRAKTALGRLAAKGLIAFEEHGGKRFARLTVTGQRAFDLAQQRSLIEQHKHKHWDKRWRVIIFDIPEHKKRIRDRLREAVRSFGFLHLQDSVWVYPHDCEDLIALLKTDLRIGKDVLYMIVESIENDGHIRRHFSV